MPPSNTITPYNVVAPTGGDDTAMLNRAFGASAIRPVFLSPGRYLISSPLTIPASGIVVGEEINIFEYYDGGTTYPGTTEIRVLSPPASFTSGQAMLNLSNYCYVRGFAVRGPYHEAGSSYGIDCISADTTAYATLDQMQALWGQDGISFANAHGLEMWRCRSQENRGTGFIGDGGAHLTDIKMIDCSSSANVLDEIYLRNLYGIQIINGRFEDSGGYGLHCEVECYSVNVENCFFDRCNSGSIHLNGGVAKVNAYIAGCRFYSTAAREILLSGGAISLHMGSNFFQTGANYTFEATAAVTLTGQIASLSNIVDGGSIGLYADSTTEAIVSPLVINRGPSEANQGPTTSRPTSNRGVGGAFFDTTLGKPIWWNGTTWVDATGVPG